LRRFDRWNGTKEGNFSQEMFRRSNKLERKMYFAIGFIAGFVVGVGCVVAYGLAVAYQELKHGL
jgi:hypothetical protein